jgi:hypothetical protein
MGLQRKVAPGLPDRGGLQPLAGPGDHSSQAQQHQG